MVWSGEWKDIPSALSYIAPTLAADKLLWRGKTACLSTKISRRFMSSKFSLFYFLFIIWISNTIFIAGDNWDSFEWRQLPKISNHSQIWYFHKSLKENKEALYPSSSNHPSYHHPPFQSATIVFTKSKYWLLRLAHSLLRWNELNKWDNLINKSAHSFP